MAKRNNENSEEAIARRKAEYAEKERLRLENAPPTPDDWVETLEWLAGGALSGWWGGVAAGRRLELKFIETLPDASGHERASDVPRQLAQAVHHKMRVPEHDYGREEGMSDKEFLGSLASEYSPYPEQEIQPLYDFLLARPWLCDETEGLDIQVQASLPKKGKAKPEVLGEFLACRIRETVWTTDQDAVNFRVWDGRVQVWPVPPQK